MASLKRSAPTKDSKGPPRKKRNVEGSASQSRKPPSKAAPAGKKTKFDDRDRPAPKRKAPITSKKPLRNESDTSEDDDEESSGSENGGSDDGGEDAMEVDGQAKSKPKAAGDKDNHTEQRRLAKERRLARPNGTLLAEAKAQWELARQLNLPKGERQKHIAGLMEVVKGKVKDLVTKHDASRVIQTLVKHGNQAQRDQVATELAGSFLSLSQSKYSKFLVLKLLRHTSAPVRSKILSEFHGKVISRMLLHKEATTVISDAYELYAGNAEERNLLVKDFYGSETSLFPDDLEKVRKGGLSAVLAGVDDARKERILTALRENLLKLFNNPDKGAVGHSIVHRALWEYLQEISKVPSEEEQKKRRTEMFESCVELLAELAHTRDGSRSVREFVAWGSASDRKKVLKTFKPHLEKTCLDDQAQLVLFTCLDAIDDTKTATNDLVKHIVNLAPKLVFPSSSVEGSGTATSRRTLLYLLVPRDQRYFPPALARTIAETDEILMKTSKKAVDVRMKELKTGASPKLLEFIGDEAERLLADPAASLVLVDVMLHTEGDKSAAIKALLKPLTEPSSASLPAHTARAYKTLLQGGHFSHHTKSITPVPSYSSDAFAQAMWDTVGADALVELAVRGGGAFVFTELLEKLEVARGWVAQKDNAAKIVGDAVRWEEGAKGKDVLTGKVKEVGHAV